VASAVTARSGPVEKTEEKEEQKEEQKWEQANRGEY
jgi:hypothetical protein